MKNKYLLYILLFIFVLSIGNFIYHYIISFKVNIGDVNNTINRVVKFIESTTVAEGFTKWKVVSNHAEIPSSKEDRNQPEKFKDTYQETLQKIIDAKAKNKKVKAPKKKKEEAGVEDLMDQLKKSLEMAN